MIYIFRYLVKSTEMLSALQHHWDLLNLLLLWLKYINSKTLRHETRFVRELNAYQVKRRLEVALKWNFLKFKPKVRLARAIIYILYQTFLFLLFTKKKLVSYLGLLCYLKPPRKNSENMLSQSFFFDTILYHSIFLVFLLYLNFFLVFLK